MVAASNALHAIKASFLAGAELPTLLKSCEYYLEVVSKHSNTFFKTYLADYRDTILTLMGRARDSNMQKLELNAIHNAERSSTTDFHQALRCFWMDHVERCHYFAEKVVAEDSPFRHKRFAMLYHGINSIKIIFKRKTSRKTKEAPRGSLKVLKESYKNARCTFRNKVTKKKSTL